MITQLHFVELSMAVTLEMLPSHLMRLSDCAGSVDESGALNDVVALLSSQHD